MSSILNSELGGGGSEAAVPAAPLSPSQIEAKIDAELVRRSLAGDEDAFREIVGKYRASIFSLVLDCLHNRADAEEIVADTFIRAYRGMARFRGDCSLATWLHHIALNLARNRYWYFFRRRNLSASLDAPISPDSSATLADRVPSEDPDPSHEAIDEEFAGIVRTCLRQLPASQRRILEMRGFHDCPYEEISAATGIALGTVKSRVARARRLLRQKVRRSFPEWSSQVA